MYITAPNKIPQRASSAEGCTTEEQGVKEAVHFSILFNSNFQFMVESELKCQFLHYVENFRDMGFGVQYTVSLCQSSSQDVPFSV